MAEGAMSAAPMRSSEPASLLEQPEFSEKERSEELLERGPMHRLILASEDQDEDVEVLEAVGVSDDVSEELEAESVAVEEAAEIAEVAAEEAAGDVGESSTADPVSEADVGSATPDMDDLEHVQGLEHAGGSCLCKAFSLGEHHGRYEMDQSEAAADDALAPEDDSDAVGGTMAADEVEPP